MSSTTAAGDTAQKNKAVELVDGVVSMPFKLLGVGAGKLVGTPNSAPPAEGEVPADVSVSMLPQLDTAINQSPMKPADVTSGGVEVVNAAGMFITDLLNLLKGGKGGGMPVEGPPDVVMEPLAEPPAEPPAAAELAPRRTVEVVSPDPDALTKDVTSGSVDAVNAYTQFAHDVLNRTLSFGKSPPVSPSARVPAPEPPTKPAEEPIAKLAPEPPAEPDAEPPAAAELSVPKLRQVSTDPCCAAGTLVYKDSTPDAGAVEAIDGLDVYIVGKAKADTAIIVGTDIFGFATASMRRNADMLAESMGCVVAVPDHFRGKTASELPELTPEAIGAFNRECGQFEPWKDDLLERVVPLMQGRGCTRLNYLGFCWGGKMALTLVADAELSKCFIKAGGIHASLKEPQADASRATFAKLPLMLLQASNDAPLPPLWEALQASPTAGKHVARTYYEVAHGFCGARADRSDPVVRAAVKSALQTTIDFFALPTEEDLEYDAVQM